MRQVVGRGVDLVHVLLKILLNGRRLPLDRLHFAVERIFQLVSSAAEFGERFTDCFAEFGQLLWPENDERDDKDDDHLLNANWAHRIPPSLPIVAHALASGVGA